MSRLYFVFLFSLLSVHIGKNIFSFTLQKTSIHYFITAYAVAIEGLAGSKTVWTGYILLYSNMLWWTAPRNYLSFPLSCYLTNVPSSAG